MKLTAAVILSLGITYSLSFSCFRCFTLRERAPLYPSNVRQGGSQNSSGCLKVAENLLPVLEVE